MKKYFSISSLLVSLSLMSCSAFASIVEVHAPKGGADVLPSAITASIDGGKTTLNSVASGLRRKKIALFWVKVYVAQFYASQTPTKPTLDDLSKSPVVAVSLSLKRNLGPDKLKTGFRDSLEKNSVDVKSAAVQPLFDALEKAGEQKDGQTVWMILRRKADGSETVFLESGSGMLQTLDVEKGMLKNLLSIWFGVPSDSGMEELQKQILSASE